MASKDMLPVAQAIQQQPGFALSSSSSSSSSSQPLHVIPSTISITSPLSSASNSHIHTSASYHTESLLANSMPSSGSAPARSKARGQRGDSNHIPRPPNAFILFRSAVIRQQRIPDRVEGNHSNLSKIIGSCCEPCLFPWFCLRAMHHPRVNRTL